MKEKSIIAAIAAIVLATALLLMPPGLTSRIASLVRIITHPALAWSDWTARISLATIGNGSPVPEQEKITQLQYELAVTQTELTNAWALYSSALLENRFLKDRLRLVYDDSVFTLTLCKVMKRDPISSYYDTIIINGGFKTGLKVGQIVLSIPPSPKTGEQREPPSLLGIIRDVSRDSAIVTLTTAADFSIACRIPERNVTGLITGRVNSNQTGPAISIPPGNLLMSHPTEPPADPVQVGDKVYTSALGDNSESVDNIYVGTVDEISTSEIGAPVLHIRPAVTNEQLNYVLVALKTTPEEAKKKQQQQQQQQQ
jgi:cell shape-determining protein MreC